MFEKNLTLMGRAFDALLLKRFQEGESFKLIQITAWKSAAHHKNGILHKFRSMNNGVDLAFSMQNDFD